jgi:hypothetical protein
MDWGEVHICELGVVALIAACWAISAALTVGSRWRWVVFAWMASKAAFFWILFWTVLNLPRPAPSSGPVTEVVLAAFAICHLVAFLTWLQFSDYPRGT